MTKAAWMWLLCALRAKSNSHSNPFYIKTSHVGGRRRIWWCRHMVETHDNGFQICLRLKWQTEKIRAKSSITASLKWFIAALWAGKYSQDGETLQTFFISKDIQCVLLRIKCRIKGNELCFICSYPSFSLNGQLCNRSFYFYFLKYNMKIKSLDFLRCDARVFLFSFYAFCESDLSKMSLTCFCVSSSDSVSVAAFERGRIQQYLLVWKYRDRQTDGCYVSVSMKNQDKLFNGFQTTVTPPPWYPPL